MQFDRPVIVILDSLLCLSVIYYFYQIRKKPMAPSAALIIYQLGFIAAFITAFFGVLYHINHAYFFTLERYGTMFAGGVLFSILVMAAFFDNFPPQKAVALSVLPLFYLVIYTIFIFNKDYLFTYFVYLAFSDLALIFLAYSNRYKEISTIIIYSAYIIFVIAGFFAAFDFNVWFTTSEELFHLLATLTVFLIYLGIDLENSSSKATVG